MHVLATTNMPEKQKDQSLVVLKVSGSETKGGVVPSNRPSLRLVIQTYASPLHQSDLISLVEASGTL